MEFANVIGRRRMVRSFSDRPVPDTTVRMILAAACRAPTAGNTDGWAIVVLRGHDETSRLWEATTTADWRQRARRWPGLSNAPVAFVVLANPDRYIERYGEPDKVASGLGTASHLSDQPTADRPHWPVPFWFVDAGHVILSLLLAAVDADLGACFLGNFRGEDQLLEILGVPAGWRYVGSVLIGTPGSDDPRSASLDRPRRQIDDLAHFGHW